MRNCFARGCSSKEEVQFNMPRIIKFSFAEAANRSAFVRPLGAVDSVMFEEALKPEIT